MLGRDAWLRWARALLSTALLWGCAGSSEQPSRAAEPAPGYPTSGAEHAAYSPASPSDSGSVEELLAADSESMPGEPVEAQMEVTGSRLSTRSRFGPPQAAPPPPSPRDLAGAKAEAPGTPQSQPATPASDARDTERAEDHRLSLIYDARVHMAVFEAVQAIDAAEKLAREGGGYLVRRDDRSISFRVPSERFYATLEAAMKLGDVLHREVSVRDVTEEFRDLRVRLRSAEAVRDRLEQLLARAQKVEEALQVERELERVAREIEQIKGRLAMLQELTAYSTITLLFQPRPVDQVGPEVRLPFPWLDHLGLTELLQL